MDDLVPIGSTEAGGGSAPPSPVSGLDSQLKDVTGKLADTQREKIGATDKVFNEIESTQARMLPRIEQLSKNVGVEAGNLKPWNADDEMAKRRTDPIAAFGSFGSVFGIVASAFTSRPMENALNASAAAMNAIKENDKEGYERAYKAWEANNKQTLERHKIQHDAYQDAVSLLQTNMSAAQTKMQVVAARFGDKQVLTMLEAGMSKEVQDLLSSREKLAQELSMNAPKIAEENARVSRLFALGFDPTNPQSEESQEAFKKYRQETVDFENAKRVMTPEQNAYLEFKKQNPDATAEEHAEYVQRLRQRDRPLTPEQQATNTFIEQNPDATAEQISEFVTNLRAKSKGGAGGGGNTTLTGERQRAQDVNAIVDKYKKDNPEATPEDIAKKRADTERELKTRSATSSGNQLNDMASRRDRVTYMTDTIDKVESLLAKHKALTGIGGTVTRPMEAIGNVFGSNDTDRAQFKRYISELQEWGPRILNDSNGRPLSAEAGKIANIIAGLNPGDTTANTVRAYRELKPLLGTIKQQLEKRLEGDRSAPAPGGSTQPKPGDNKNSPWLRDPVVKKSEIGSESDAA